jgi:hypothetical protein
MFLGLPKASPKNRGGYVDDQKCPEVQDYSLDIVSNHFMEAKI